VPPLRLAARHERKRTDEPPADRSGGVEQARRGLFEPVDVRLFVNAVLEAIDLVEPSPYEQECHDDECPGDQYPG
jgi:hypothetical protein